MRICLNKFSPIGITHLTIVYYIFDLSPSYLFCFHLSKDELFKLLFVAPFRMFVQPFF